MENFVEVFYKKNYGEQKALGIKNRLTQVGLKNITEVVPSTLYKLTGNFTAAQIRQIGSSILTDPVLETFTVNPKKRAGFFKVQVWIRDSSTDVIGESVRDAVEFAGFMRPKVRIAPCFAVKGSFKKSELETAVKKTFVNEVVNKFVIEEA